MSESPNKRTQRVSALIRETLASIFVDGLRDPRVGFVTVTEVRATPDLKTAKIFVSVYGTDAERQASVEGLNDAAGFLRRELSHRLELRFTPELLFVLDTTLDQATRLETLMSAIAKGEIETPPLMPTELAPVQTERSVLAESAKQFAARREAERSGKAPGPHAAGRRRHGRRRREG